MDNNKLEYFISAAQTLNFSEVARMYHISQPAISHHIGLLEEELDTKLFRRVGKQLFLTSEGELFLSEAIKILETINNATISVKRHSQGKQGKVSIAVANSCSAEYRKCIEEFHLYYPDIMIETTVVLGSEQDKAVINGEFDFYFVVENLIKSNSNFDYVVTHRDELCLAMPKSYPQHANIDDLSGLSNYPFIGLSFASEPMLNKVIYNVCIRRGYIPYVVHQYNRMEAVIWSVEAGAGISIIPRSLITLYNTENINFIPIPGEDVYTNCVIAWHIKSINSSAIRFKGVVLSIYSK